MPKLDNLFFITGGARSGKSNLAQTLASQSAKQVIYIATMDSSLNDAECQNRIERHRLDRPSDWQTHEVTKNMTGFINSLPAENLTVLIDCLSLYISNTLLVNIKLEYNDLEKLILDDVNNILGTIENHPNFTFIVVTNEVGSGLVPMDKTGRYFRDILGLANKNFASRANEVYFMVSGLKLEIKN